MRDLARMANMRRSLFLYAGLAGFVIYYGIDVFRYQWVGDIHLYLAGVHALYVEPWLPKHEAIAVEGVYSAIYTPYLVLIGVVGKTLHVSPYRALQLAGVANLLIYAGAIVLFFRTFASNPKSPWPPLIFIGVTLFLRSENYTWSSETSHQTIRLIQAYPSLLGWALAMVAFVLVERVVRGIHVRATLAALTLLIAFLLLSHMITATWVVGIVGLRALYAVADTWYRTSRQGESGSSAALRETVTIAGSIFAAIVAAVCLSLLWPYYSLFLLAKFGSVTEGAPFGSRPVQIFPAVYALGLLAAISAITSRRHMFWIVAFVATTGAWAFSRLAHIDYGDRYVFFMAFFPQIMIADAASLAIERVWRQTYDHKQQRLAQIIAGTYLVALGITILRAPTMQGQWGDVVRGPAILWRRPATEQAYYDHWEPLRAAIKPGDVVMVPLLLAGYDIAAVTGARTVAVTNTPAVPDIADRTSSVERFFSKEASAETRLSELKRWHANKIVLVGPALKLAPDIEALFGAPLWRNETAIVYSAQQN